MVTANNTGSETAQDLRSRHDALMSELADVKAKVAKGESLSDSEHQKALQTLGQDIWRYQQFSRSGLSELQSEGVSAGQKESMDLVRNIKGNHPDILANMRQHTDFAESLQDVPESERQSIDPAVRTYLSESEIIARRGGSPYGSENEAALNRLFENTGIGQQREHDYGLIGNAVKDSQEDNPVEALTLRIFRQRVDEGIAAVPGGSAQPSLWSEREEKRWERAQRNRMIAERLKQLPAIDRRTELEPGRYVADDNGSFRRIGDVGDDLIRYHGSPVPKGETIERFDLRAAYPNSVNRPTLGNAPSIYTTSNVHAAISYATPSEYQAGREGQLYTLRIRPKTIIDLKECDDDEVAFRAVQEGFDVVECPDFWEQPEAIVFDPDIVSIEKIHPVNPSPGGKSKRLIEKFIGDRLEDDEETANRDYGSEDTPYERLKSVGDIGEPIYDSATEPRQSRGAQKVASISEALDDYQSSRKNETTTQRADARMSRGMEYRSPSRQPTYTPRGGRGSMRY